MPHSTSYRLLYVFPSLSSYRQRLIHSHSDRCTHGSQSYKIPGRQRFSSRVHASPHAQGCPKKHPPGGRQSTEARREEGLFWGRGDEGGTKVDRDCAGLLFTVRRLAILTDTTNQGTESDNQLFYEGTRCKGKMIHVYPDPCRVVAGNLVGWARRGAKSDWDYTYIYGQGLVPGSHYDCPNRGCNRRNLYRRRQ